ncbi:MbtH protein [Lentzea pudingi]|uniref:MbtH protein n=1 Tax=Lentzea pudingi TaxID=1789439 RepID=A0ABQ2HRB6_9PSEU|nr:MbtH family NRPS accessory protein [Lentzea pudingi]GGM89375.1 MbtH protein [Lentzea pudingi]
MSELFDDPDGEFVVLVNNEFQHSLWPAVIPVPDGWTAVSGPAARSSCLEEIRARWTDMRPASLRAQMEATRS